MYECGKEGEMNFEEWKQGVPERINADPQWKFYAYPRALFLYELVWRDYEKLMQDRRGTRTSSDLVDKTIALLATEMARHQKSRHS